MNGYLYAMKSIQAPSFDPLSSSSTINVIMAVSLSDHYVVLLQKVVDESKSLHDEVKGDKAQDRAALRDISEKVDNLSARVDRIIHSRPASRVRQTGGAIKVPKMCSVSSKSYFICVTSITEIGSC